MNQDKDVYKRQGPLREAPSGIRCTGQAVECIREMPVCRNPSSLRKEQAVFCMRQHRKPVEKQRDRRQKTQRRQKGESCRNSGRNANIKRHTRQRKKERKQRREQPKPHKPLRLKQGVWLLLLLEKAKVCRPDNIPHVGSSCRSHQGQVSWRLHHIGTCLLYTS